MSEIRPEPLFNQKELERSPSPKWLLNKHKTETPSVITPTGIKKAKSFTEIKNQNEKQNQFVERTKRITMMKEAADCRPDSKRFLYQIYATQIGLAVIASAIAAAFLYFVNPPLTQYISPDEFTSEKQDWRKVLIACTIVLVFVFVLPEIFKILKFF